MAISKSALAQLSLVLCNIVWACNYPLYSLILGHYVAPLAMVAGSLAIAAAWSLVPLAWEKSERVEPNDRVKIVGAGLLMGAVKKLCMMYGMAQTSPIDGSIIGTTTPLLVLLLSVFVGAERFTKMKVVGLLFGMAGAIAVIISSREVPHEQSGVEGNLLIFASACSSALYMVYFKGLVSKYRITTLLRWIYCSSALVMLPIGAHDIVTTDLSAMSMEVLLAMLFLLIVPTYLPNLLLNYSLRWVAPTLTSIYAYIQPVVAIALAVAMGIDRLHIDTVLYALAIFVGVGLVVFAYRAEDTKR